MSLKWSQLQIIQEYVASKFRSYNVYLKYNPYFCGKIIEHTR